MLKLLKGQRIIRFTSYRLLKKYIYINKYIYIYIYDYIIEKYKRKIDF